MCSKVGVCVGCLGVNKRSEGFGLQITFWKWFYGLVAQVLGMVLWASGSGFGVVIRISW